jgi:predicted amidohydrolase
MGESRSLKVNTVRMEYTCRIESGQVQLHLSQEWRLRCTKPLQETLAHVPPSAHLTVFSEHPDAHQSLELLQRFASDHSQILVVPLGARAFDGEACNNRVAVLWPGGQAILDKLSLSADDQKGGVVPGGGLFLFETPLGRIAVLNCHEYTHIDLLHKLAEWEVEIVVVVTVNQASRLYGDYAQADAHRLFSFIIIGNIADYGGAAVFAPFRNLGTPMRIGGRLLHTRGPAELRADVPLDMAQLRKLREEYRKNGDSYRPEEIEAVVPPERFLFESMNLIPHLRHGSDGKRALDRVMMYHVPAVKPVAPKARIAVAQLEAPSLGAYLETGYRFSHAREYPVFRELLRQHLSTLERSLILREQHLDFLVFPEVFLPREMFEELQGFAVRQGTIVIAGAEYAHPDPERLRMEGIHGANECVIFVPESKGRGSCTVHTYRKLTRSQYDARGLGPNGQLGEKFSLDLGERLLRFRHPVHGDFGVLICYDFSHLDIVRSLNLLDATVPCELLFVVSYNPDAELYRACCIADAHRFYQYVVMCNVANFGGSGVFGPVRTRGSRQVLTESGKGMEGILMAEVDLAGLRFARSSQDPVFQEGKFQRRPGVFHGRMILEQAT